jgi:hypothetical protein
MMATGQHDYQLQIFDGKEYVAHEEGDDGRELAQRYRNKQWLSPRAWCAAFYPQAKTHGWRVVKILMDRPAKPRWYQPRISRKTGISVEMQAERYADWLIEKRGKEDIGQMTLWNYKRRAGNAYLFEQTILNRLQKKGVKNISWKCIDPDTFHTVIEEHDVE